MCTVKTSLEMLKPSLKRIASDYRSRTFMHTHTQNLLLIKSNDELIVKLLH